MDKIYLKSFSKQASKQARRENWIDELKGMLILSVILGHSIMLVNANDVLQKVILILIYTCHMPMFFVLSGYVLKVEDNPNILRFANKK